MFRDMRDVLGYAWWLCKPFGSMYRACLALIYVSFRFCYMYCKYIGVNTYICSSVVSMNCGPECEWQR